MTLDHREKTWATDDSRIKDVTTVPPPENLIRFFPIEWTPVESQIRVARDAVSQILHWSDDRLVVVVWPCSIHDPTAALEYAAKLAKVREHYKDTLEVIMRVYFEKPRTTVGWKWLINDPYLDESYKIDEWLRIARQLLIDVNKLWVPAGTEFLDVISPQYVWDIISWWAIWARTAESQVHRELASWLSAPIGIKNGTDGNLQIALDAILAASRWHHFLSVHKSGQVAIVQTKWNTDCHLILRWGKTPNYDASHVAWAAKKLIEAGISWNRIMIDASHGNSSKDHTRQGEVVRDIAEQIGTWQKAISWVMIESHLKAWAQKYTPGKDNPALLEYGKSITDACIDWTETVWLLEELSQSVKRRRER